MKQSVAREQLLAPQEMLLKPNEAMKPCQDWSHPSLYFNRELSWFLFNQRVLEQAHSIEHPLLERIKFFAISASNLDEFCMIRLAIILKKIRLNVNELTPDGLTLNQQFLQIQEITKLLMSKQARCWSKVLKPALEKEAIRFLEPADYDDSLREQLKDYFKKQIGPILTPLAFEPGHPFPHVSNLSLNFAVVVSHQGQTKFARVKIPSTLSRFIPVPSSNGKAFVYVEDLIREHLDELFPGVEILETYLFRVIRDMDMVIDQEEADDLLESVDRSLQKTRYNSISFLQVEAGMPQDLLEIFSEYFDISPDLVTRSKTRMGFRNWMSLRDLDFPHLKYPFFRPYSSFDFQDTTKLLDKIRHKDYLIHHPYESFGMVIDFLKAAAEDPQVVAIKMTLYRIGEDSPIMEQLIEAVRLGKQVIALVELKARFDERSNMVWAKELESNGVHVVYGMFELKTHCKLCLVIRQESDGIRRYLHVGTGNYNATTASSYTDMGLFTARAEITEDASQVFHYLTGYSEKKHYPYLLVAPINLRSGIIRLIEREIEHVRAGLEGKIIIKVNTLADIFIIRKLYEASQAGVSVDLIIRGVCCLKPGVEGVSENIRVISVIGRFLEHSRVYYFHNNGDSEAFLGSADLMRRNLNRRVEVLCPVLDPKLREHLKEVVLDTLLNELAGGYQLTSNGDYRHRSSKKRLRPHAQQQLLEQYLLHDF